MPLGWDDAGIDERLIITRDTNMTVSRAGTLVGHDTSAFAYRVYSITRLCAVQAAGKEYAERIESKGCCHPTQGANFIWQFDSIGAFADRCSRTRIYTNKFHMVPLCSTHAPALDSSPWDLQPGLVFPPNTLENLIKQLPGRS